MIEITIKTLDSQNHSFSVPDDTTVKQFKEKIFEKLPFPVDSQRLIYCGRVLQDDKNLTEYDVNGKVIHLVQRPPPQASQPSAPSNRAPGSGSRGASSGRERRFVSGQTFRSRLDGGNAMYLGAMAIPADVMDASGIATPQPSTSLSQSRLTVARRMIRSAAATLSLMENAGADPTADGADPAADGADPAVDGAATPPSGSSESESNGEGNAVPTMREVGSVLVINPEQSSPNSGEHPFMQPSTAAVIASAFSAARSSGIASHMTISSRSRGAEPVSLSVDMDSQGNITHVSNDGFPPAGEPPSPPQEASDAPGVQRRPSRPGYARPAALCALLDELNGVNQRLQPFYQRYQHLMRDDPPFQADEAGVAEASAANMVFTQVSEVMHCLSHAYHALSDIMCDFATPPPRVLRCRPVLIQHSAVLQAGIPISAQISMLANRGAGNQQPAAAAATSSPSEEAAQTPTPPTAAAPTTEAGGPPTDPATPTTTQQQPRVRIVRAGNTNSRGLPSMMNMNMAPENVEFIMEVGPGSITIDSVEATLMSGNTAVPLGSLGSMGTFDASMLGEGGALLPWGPAPPEFIQNLMQVVAGHMINRSNAESVPNTATSTPATTGGSDPPGVPGQNSQARGNTATHPTTSTQTRSTSRPHVHLAQAVPSFGGCAFDPFLPCNSHHVVRGSARRRVRHRAQPQQEEPGADATRPAPATAEATSQGTSPDEQDALMNLLEGIIGGYSAEAAQPAQAGATTTAPISQLLNMMFNMGGNQAPTSGDGGSFAISMPAIQQIVQGLGGALLGQAPGTTLADILQTIPDHNYTEGEFLTTDLIMTLARNLSFQDMLALTMGRGDSLNHLQPQLREFVMRRVLQNEPPTLVNIASGAERMTSELRPYLEVLHESRVRSDIDVVHTVNHYTEMRLAEMIDVVVRDNNPSTFGNWLTSWCRTYLSELCAILCQCYVDGMVGLERILQSYMRQLTSGIPPAMQEFTTTSSLAHLRTYAASVQVPVEAIQRHLIHTTQAPPIALPPPPESQVVVEGAMEVKDEPMETDASEPDVAVAEVVIAETPRISTLVANADTLPVIIPETWHNALPTDWVPIISRDSQRQRRQNPQTPFSDAYLSGMPSKRRKVVSSAKPQGSLSEVISDGVRHAVGVTGIPPSTGTVDNVAEAASADPNVQAAYRDQVRNVVRDSLTNNPDYVPERFPNTAKYITKK